MRNKWASCSSNGNLNFNSELLHFSVPNHGKLWKSLMTAHLGDYEPFERRLKEASRPGAN